MIDHLTDDTILRYVSHSLPDDAQSAIENHLAACESCQARVDEWRGIASAVYRRAKREAVTLPPLEFQENEIVGTRHAVSTQKTYDHYSDNHTTEGEPPMTTIAYPLPKPRQNRALHSAGIAAALVLAFAFVLTMLLNLDPQPPASGTLAAQDATPMPPETFDIVVAKVDIARGTEITAEMVELHTVTRDDAPFGATILLEEAIGSIALDDIAAGEHIHIPVRFGELFTTLNVVVAKGTIPRGTEITADMIEMRTWPTRAVSFAAVGNRQDAIGMIARTDILPEQPILLNLITDDPNNVASVDDDYGIPPEPMYIELVNVVVPTHTIQRGEIITADDVRLQPWLAAATWHNTMTRLDSVIGTTARTDIVVEQPILSTMIRGEPTGETAPEESIYNLLAEYDDLSTFRELIDLDTDLFQPLLQSIVPSFVIAPTNDAFALLNESDVTALHSDTNLLRDFLNVYIYPGNQSVSRTFSDTTLRIRRLHRLSNGSTVLVVDNMISTPDGVFPVRLSGGPLNVSALLPAGTVAFSLQYPYGRVFTPGDTVNILATLCITELDGEFQTITPPADNQSCQLMTQTMIEGAQVMQVLESDNVANAMIALAVSPQDSAVLTWLTQSSLPLTPVLAESQTLDIPEGHVVVTLSMDDVNSTAGIDPGDVLHLLATDRQDADEPMQPLTDNGLVMSVSALNGVQVAVLPDVAEAVVGALDQGKFITLALTETTQSEEINVVVATHAIRRGSIIAEETVALAAFPADAVPFNSITNIEDVIGKRARIDIFIDQPILSSMVVDDLSSLPDASATIPPGTVALALPLNTGSSIGYILQSGDVVDLYVSFCFAETDDEFQSITPDTISSPTDIAPNTSDCRRITQRVVQNALVVYVGDFPADGSLFEEDATPTPAPRTQPPDIITLAVAPETAPMLTWIVEANLPITFVMPEAMNFRLPGDEIISTDLPEGQGGMVGTLDQFMVSGVDNLQPGDRVIFETRLGCEAQACATVPAAWTAHATILSTSGSGNIQFSIAPDDALMLTHAIESSYTLWMLPDAELPDVQAGHVLVHIPIDQAEVAEDLPAGNAALIIRESVVTREAVFLGELSSPGERQNTVSVTLPPLTAQAILHHIRGGGTITIVAQEDIEPGEA